MTTSIFSISIDPCGRSWPLYRNHNGATCLIATPTTIGAPSGCKINLYSVDKIKIKSSVPVHAVIGGATKRIEPDKWQTLTNPKSFATITFQEATT